MKIAQLVAATAAAALLIPGSAVADKGGKPHGKPDGAGPPAHAQAKQHRTDAPAPAAADVTAQDETVLEEAPVVEEPVETPATLEAPAAEPKRAYGKLCAGQSRKRVAGQKGTPFSRCVTAMARAASGEATSAKAACKGLSKKHVKGTKGTPFSRCVVAAAKLLEQQETEQAPGEAPVEAPAEPPVVEEPASEPVEPTDPLATPSA